MQSPMSNSLQLKALLLTSKKHWIQKVIQYHVELNDAFKHHATSTMSIFIPKLKLDFPTPCVMFHMKNGGGRCYIRCTSPVQLANHLEQLCVILRSNLWADIWLHLDGTGQDIIDNNFVNDEKYIDMDKDWQKQG